MITNFEEITVELSVEETKMLELLMKGLRDHRKHNPIKAKDIVLKFNKYLEANQFTERLTQVRLRKIINYLRTNALLPVVATSKGYYVSFDKKVLYDQVSSLEERSNSIARAARGINKIITKIKKDEQEVN